MGVSTCHRYATTLLELAALERSAEGRYFPGIRLISLGQAWLDRNSLRKLARAELEELCALAGETVYLGVNSDQGVVYIDKIDPAQPVRLASRIGSVVPYHCSAKGKAILATYSPEQRLPYMTDVRIYTPTTLSGQALEDEIEAIAARRYAINDQEFEEGVRCVGVAIVGRGGELHGAISVAGPAVRFSRQDCIDLAPRIIAAADRIGSQMPRYI